MSEETAGGGAWSHHRPTLRLLQHNNGSPHDSVHAIMVVGDEERMTQGRAGWSRSGCAPRWAGYRTPPERSWVRSRVVPFLGLPFCVSQSGLAYSTARTTPPDSLARKTAARCAVRRKRGGQVIPPPSKYHHNLALFARNRLGDADDLSSFHTRPDGWVTA